MATAGYVLQSLLYTVALHRHLRLRLGASRYAYEQNFGGVLYLFVRGMAGPTTPRCEVSGHALGVHGHRWSPEVVHALDEALAGAEPMAAGARAKGAER
jgi:exodeoxyribonuclease V beta subunit